MSKILIIAPHHDDEVIGCGGTIYKHCKEGDKACVVYITSGWSGIPEEKTKKEAIKVREKEARSACKKLGVEKTIFLRENDRNIYNRKGEIVKELVKIVRDIRPRLVYAPHSRERDVEHRITYEMTKEALWLSKTSYLPKLGKPNDLTEAVRLYEVWTPMESFFVKEDITNVIDIKKKALAAYESQAKHLNLVDAVVGLNMYRGSMGNLKKEFAEVFQIEKF